MDSIYTKNKFYLLLSFGAISLTSGLYLIYKSFRSKAKPKLEEEPKTIIKPNKLSKEYGLEIFNKITYAYEEYLEQTDTINHKQTRMTYLDKPEEYARLCGAIIAQRNKEYVVIRNKILNEHNITEQQYHEFLGQISMLECEISLFSNYKPKLPRYPDANTVKEAFFLFAETMINVHERYANVQQAEIKNAYFLLEKLRIEDEIYLRYGLSYFLIKYFIHEYNLFDDQKVKDYYYILPLLK
jgi:hypothetical protein